MGKQDVESRVDKAERSFYDVDRLISRMEGKPTKRRKASPKKSHTREIADTLIKQGGEWAIFAPLALRISRKVKYFLWRRTSYGLQDSYNSILTEAISLLPKVWANYDPELSETLFNNAMMVIDRRLNAETYRLVKEKSREAEHCVSLETLLPRAISVPDETEEDKINRMDMEMDVQHAVRHLTTGGKPNRFFSWVCANIMAGRNYGQIAEKVTTSGRPLRSTGRAVVQQMMLQSNIRRMLHAYRRRDAD